MEQANLVSLTDAAVIPGPNRYTAEFGLLRGIYTFECYRPKAGLEADYAPLFTRKSELQNKIDGGQLFSDAESHEYAYLRRKMQGMRELVWGETTHNIVCTVGKNLALDTFLAGSAHTVVGPYLGLISSVSYTGVLAADTMASHSGWTEAGTTNAPQWTTPASGARHTTAAGWSAATGGIKALSAAKSFAISTSGVVKGAFLLYGTGAVATAMDTNGTLMSAGTFSGGDKTVASLDTLNVSYSLQF